MEKLDSFDRQILSLMEIDARQNGQQLSEAIGLSPAACLRRLQRLRKIGAIEREVAIVNPAYRRKGTQIIVPLTIERQNLKRIDSLMRRFSNHPDVEHVWAVTGNDDIVLQLNCESMDSYSEFADEFLFEPPVEGFLSLVVIKEIKRELPRAQD
ncbi:MAG: Lrp/AsnC family transcriptional regulator [Pseudomonadota bacterium]